MSATAWFELRKWVNKYGAEAVLDAALKGGLLHGTEDEEEEEDPYK